MMSNLELIVELCAVVESQNAIIRQLVIELEQFRTMSDEEKRQVDDVKQRYTAILGADEIPDEYEM